VRKRAAGSWNPKAACPTHLRLRGRRLERHRIFHAFLPDDSVELIGIEAVAAATPWAITPRVFARSARRPARRL